MLHRFWTCWWRLSYVLGLFIIVPAAGQTLPEKLATFLQKQAADKINLITDKPYYLAGDTVFYRVHNLRQTADNLVEVQLITPEVGPTSPSKVLLTNGIQVSYLVLPKESISGDYIVRAFSPVGWESSVAVSVYNPDQKNTEYQICKWIHAEISPQLTLTRQSSHWEISWNLNQPYSASNGWLIITGPNQLYYSQAIDFSQLRNKVTVPLDALPATPAQIMLASNTGEIICNYALTLAKTQNNELQLNLNKSTYQNREAVELHITAAPNFNKSENSAMAIRVLEQLDTLKKDINIFKNPADGVVLEKTFPQVNLKKIVTAASPVNDYIFVLKGQLISEIDEKPVANSLIHLLVPATNQMEVLYTDKEGRVQVELDPFEKTKPILFRAIHEGEEMKNITFLPDSSQNTLSWKPVFTTKNLTTPQQVLIGRLKMLHVINQAFYGSLGNEDQSRSSLLMPTAFQERKLKPTTRYDLSKYEKFNNVTEIFRELVPAVEVVKRKDGMRARLYARLLKKFYNYYPLFLIDGIPTYDVETILNIPANQLVKIDVFNTATALAPFDVLSTGGVIALYTQNRNFNPALLHDNVIEFPGTAPAYVVALATKPETNSPNLNHVVYWNPQVPLNTNGSTTATFLTNDQIGRFTVEVSYYNSLGELITTAKSFNVAPSK